MRPVSPRQSPIAWRKALALEAEGGAEGEDAPPLAAAEEGEAAAEGWVPRLPPAPEAVAAAAALRAALPDCREEAASASAAAAAAADCSEPGFLAWIRDQGGEAVYNLTLNSNTSSSKGLNVRLPGSGSGGGARQTLTPLAGGRRCRRR